MWSNLTVTAGRPWWLLLIPLILPPLVLLSYRGLSGLGTFRRWVAIGLRGTVLVLIILALADLQSVRKSENLTTVFVVDVSQSIPQELRKSGARLCQRIDQETPER